MKFSSYRVVWMLWALSMAACTEGQVDCYANTRAGKTWGVCSAAVFDITVSDDPNTTLAVRLSDNETVCADRQEHRNRIGEHFIAVAVTGADPMRAGTFGVRTDPGSTNPVVTASLQATDQSCQVILHETATDGLVTLTRTGKEIEGTFDFTFDNEDNVSGSFKAVRCTGHLAEVDPAAQCNE